jgi:hypothetical protein
MSTMYDDVNDFLLSGGVPSCTWPAVGTVHSGTVTDFRIEQARDFETGKPKFWDDGNPVKQLVVTLQTDERDRDDDDGLRALYCRGALLKAIREAVRPHGGIAQGGKLGVKFTGEGEKPKPHLNAPKLFKVEYAAPVKAANLDDAMSGGGDEPLI